MKDKIKKAIFNSVKNTIMGNNMKNKKDQVRDSHAETIIRNHVIWSMGAGFIPVLIADIFAVSALQLDMIRQLCKVYDLDFEETRGKALVTSLTSSTLARLGARSLIKLIPGVGSMLGGVTVSAFAGASTYALGEVFKKHFESGGTILDFDPDRVKKYYTEKFEKGKKVAKEWKAEQQEMYDGDGPIEDIEVEKEEVVTDKASAENTPKAAPETEAPEEDIASTSAENSNDPLKRLRELGELKKAGVITQKEFDQMKKKIINEF